jgi:hypothetical protein
MSPHITPPRTEWKALVESAGGTLTTSRPKIYDPNVITITSECSNDKKNRIFLKVLGY